MTSEFFWPSLIMAASACFICLGIGFNLGRIYQEDKDAEIIASAVTEEEVKRMIDRALADFTSGGKTTM